MFSKLNLIRRVGAAAACALLVGALPIGPSHAADRGERAASASARESAAARAQLDRALQRSRSDRRFAQAAAKRDVATMSRILVASGAPRESRIVLNPEVGGPLGFYAECCRKKSWGPIVIKW